MKAEMIAYALTAAFALTGGCQKEGLSESGKAAEDARRLIQALSTNQTIGAIWKTRRIRENLKRVDSHEERRALIEEWRNGLSRISVERLSPSDRYGVLREVGRMLAWDVVDAQLDMGGTYGEMWDEYFKAIEWLDVQCARMRALALEACCDCRAWRDRWSYYQALAEYREVVVENVELNRLDERRYPNEVEKMNAIRAKFEKLIGRPVRRSEDVKDLGFYRRQVGARIQKERDARFQAPRSGSVLENTERPAAGR